MKEIDEFKKICSEVEKKSNQLKVDVNDYVAKYPSRNDCPHNELEKIEKQIAEQSEWINDVNNAYDVAKNKIIESIDCEFIKKYAIKQMDSIASVSRLAAIEEGERILSGEL